MTFACPASRRDHRWILQHGAHTMFYILVQRKGDKGCSLGRQNARPRRAQEELFHDRKRGRSTLFLQIARGGHEAQGFTLIEVLVVLSIIGVLAGLLLSAVVAARESGRRIQCMNNLKQIGIALQSYVGKHGLFPSAYATGTIEPGGPFENGPCWGWGAMILGEMDQSAVYNSINFSFSFLNGPSRTVRQVRFSRYLCPSSEDLGPIVLPAPFGQIALEDLAPGNYVASAGTRDPTSGLTADGGTVVLRESNKDGAMFVNSGVAFSQVTDGASNTLLVGERSRNLADATWVGTAPLPVGIVCARSSNPRTRCLFANILVTSHTGPENQNGQLVWVDRPNYPASGADGYWSRHPGGCNFLICDGSVRFLKDSIDPRIFGSLATRAGGEGVTAEGW